MRSSSPKSHKRKPKKPRWSAEQRLNHLRMQMRSMVSSCLVAGENWSARHIISLLETDDRAAREKA